MVDLQKKANEATHAFHAEQWRESGRLFSNLAREAEEQAKFIEKFFMDEKSLVDKDNKPITNKDIANNILGIASSAQKNAQIAEGNYRIVQDKKFIADYKRQQNAFNDLIKQANTMNSRELVGVLAFNFITLKERIREKYWNRNNTNEEIRKAYENLLHAVDDIIEQLSGDLAL